MQETRHFVWESRTHWFSTGMLAVVFLCLMKPLESGDEKMKKLSSICLAFLFIAGSLLAGPGDYVDFDDGETHIIDYHVHYSPEIPDCSVRVDYGVENDPGTELVFKTGSLVQHSLRAFNNSVITFEGGEIWGSISLIDQSNCNIFDGFINEMWINGDSKVTINGGIVAYRYISNENAKTVINGGTVSDIWGNGNSNIEIYDVISGRISAQNSCVINVLGGKISSLSAQNYGQVYVGGGEIGNAVSVEFGKMHIYGGTITNSAKVLNYGTMELAGDFYYLNPETGEYSVNPYYGTLSNPLISTYIEDPSGDYWKGKLKGTFNNGESCEFEYYIYRTNITWNCDIITVSVIDAMSLTSPNGSETYTVGTTQTLTWESEGKVFDVAISYSIDNGSSWLPINTVENTGTYSWKIPNTPSSECLIRISDADNPDTYDISDAPFTIQSAYPVLTFPNGGEQFFTGTQRTIRWNNVGTIPTIVIEYSTDNGSSWTPVEPANVGNTRSYQWTVPYEVSDSCLIRVSDADNPSSYDVSNAPFGILASHPNLWMPNGGENLLTGSNYDIRWSTTGVIENIDIHYSTDNGTTWQSVSPSNTGNTGLYAWTVPYEVSDDCLVRVSDADHPEVYDISESTFQIVSSLPKLLFPSGGEKLLSGSTVLIEWETTGVISDILIEYSLDNGTTWTEASPPNVGNTGSYDWTVPYEMSQECLVRVSDLTHPIVQDISKNIFQISPIYLNAPRVGQRVLVNSEYSIRWITGDALAEELINIQYSSNDGKDWNDLGAFENNGLYRWSVPEIESNEYLVYITLADKPDIYDMTKDTFVVYQCYEQIPGDLDGDCMVGLSDFAIIAENWMSRGKVLIQKYPLNESPNWIIEGQWEFGQPLGLGGTSYGHPDPDSGYTGTNVYGVNLAGDYNTAIGGPYSLTSLPINCRHFSNVKVSFMSWLNIDGSDYAKCSFEVSSDGTDWIILWNNTPEPITDDEWQKMEFDISEYADDTETVYLRWSYEMIDRAYPYSGWNIDDIELWGTL